MFAAIELPSDVSALLEMSVAPRRTDDWRWVRPETWHVTLGFFEDVDPHRYETLVSNLEDAAARTQPFRIALGPADVFPNADRAKVLYASVIGSVEAGRALATRVRNGASTAGVPVEGGTWIPHVTLARCNRPQNATKMLMALSTLESQPWLVSEVALYQSHMGQGPGGTPRYEVRERMALGGGVRDL